MAHRRYSKHRAKRTKVHGITFASRLEAKRYQELLALGEGGLLKDLEIQPRFRLDVGGQHVCDYVADFRYRELPRGEPEIDVVEDVKSAWTAKLPVYRLKKKLMKAVHGIDVHEHLG